MAEFQEYPKHIATKGGGYVEVNSAEEEAAHVASLTPAPAPVPVAVVENVADAPESPSEPEPPKRGPGRPRRQE